MEDNVSLRHLRVFALLLEVRSLTRAAQILDTTQSTISKILTKLRAHFGDPLFVRAGFEMHATPKATQLAASLKELLTISDAMRSTSTAFDPHTSMREFSMLLTEGGMNQLVPPIISHLEKQGPGLRLRALPLDTRSNGARLEAGEADVAVGVFPRAAGNLRRQKLYTGSFMSVVRKTHPRAGKLVKLEAFLRERHVIVTSSPTGHAAHQVLEREFTEHLDAERVHVRVPSFVTSAMVASRTDAVGTLPSRLAVKLAEDLNLIAFPTPLSLPRIEISQFWHERMHQDSGHRWFRSTIHSLFAG